MKKDDFYYGGSDDRIIDEDKIGKTPNDDTILAIVFASMSLILALFFKSGLFAIIFGLVGYFKSNSALAFDKKSTLALVAKICSLVGIILGTVFLVTCVSCVSYYQRGYNRFNPNDFRNFNGGWRY